MQELLRIDRIAVDAGFVVQMRPCRTAGRAHAADDLTDANFVADFDVDLREVAIAGRQARCRDRSRPFCRSRRSSRRRRPYPLRSHELGRRCRRGNPSPVCIAATCKNGSTRTPNVELRSISPFTGLRSGTRRSVRVRCSACVRAIFTRATARSKLLPSPGNLIGTNGPPLPAGAGPPSLRPRSASTPRSRRALPS